MKTELGKEINLNSIPLFKGLSPQTMRWLGSYLREQKFRKGDIIFYEEKSCDDIFFLKTGRAKIFRSAVCGREQVLEVLGAGDTCACHLGNCQTKCNSSMQALSDCVVWVLPRHAYARLFETNLQMAQSLNQIFANRLRQLSSLVETVALDNPRQRLVKFILDFLKRKQAGDSFRKPMDLALTHEEIAQRVGLVRETVTRHLQELKRDRLISLKPRCITVLDCEKLKKLLEV